MMIYHNLLLLLFLIFPLFLFLYLSLFILHQHLYSLVNSFLGFGLVGAFTGAAFKGTAFTGAAFTGIPFMGSKLILRLPAGLLTACGFAGPFACPEAGTFVKGCSFIFNHLSFLYSMKFLIEFFFSNIN